MPRKAIAESAAKFDRIRRAHQSEVAEDYVEMIADLIAETGEARTVDLAARFGVTSPTVNAIIQRLQREDLVETRPYRSIFLTEAGQALAKEARDRHRIVRDFLVAIGVPETIAEEDAEGNRTSCQCRNLGGVCKNHQSRLAVRLAVKMGVTAIQCLYGYKDRGFYCG
jgi:DtxR family manganese transport transcriptional regulator